MELEEIWRDIEGYEGLYQISNIGRMGTFRMAGNRKITSCMKLMKTTIDTTGYCRVGLYNKNGVLKIADVHRLVAIAFIPNPENKKYVNHKNYNRSDNRVDNLEWVTHSENQTHGILKKATTSLYYGVNFNEFGSTGKPRKNPWYAKIPVGGKREHLGCFATEMEAHEAVLDGMKKRGIENKYSHHKRKGPLS